jgi:hypothetical protein
MLATSRIYTLVHSGGRQVREGRFQQGLNWCLYDGLMAICLGHKMALNLSAVCLHNRLWQLMLPMAAPK